MGRGGPDKSGVDSICFHLTLTFLGARPTSSLAGKGSWDHHSNLGLPLGAVGWTFCFS